MEADGGEIGAQQPPPVDPLQPGQDVLAGGAGDAHHAPAGGNQVAVEGDLVQPLQHLPGHGVEELVGGLDGDGDEDDDDEDDAPPPEDQVAVEGDLVQPLQHLPGPGVEELLGGLDGDGDDEDGEDDAAPPEDQPLQHQPGPGVEELLGGQDGHHAAADGVPQLAQLGGLAVAEEVEQGPLQPAVPGALPQPQVGDDDDDLEPLLPQPAEVPLPLLPAPPAQVQVQQIQGGLPEPQPQPQELGLINQQNAVAPNAIVEQLLVDEHGLAPAQGQLGGDDDEDEVNENQGGQPQEHQQQVVDLVEQEELQQEEEIAAFAGQLPLVPFPAPAGASTQIYWLFWVLAGITALVLGAVMVAELGVDITTWATTLKRMTAKEWQVALILAVGDMTSLGLTYTPIWRFMALWQGEGGGAAAGIAALVPPVVALVNVTVWFCYGLAVDGTNASVSIINGTAMVFQSIYIFVFCARSQEPPTRKLTVLLLGAGAGVLIAVVDVLILRDTLGIRIDDAISWSGAVTSAATYCFAGLVNMVAAHVNLGADGMPPQGLASFANAAVWLAYARATDKFGMQVASWVGVLCFLVQAGQLLFYRCFKKPHQQQQQQQQEEDRDAELRRRLLDDQV